MLAIAPADVCLSTSVQRSYAGVIGADHRVVDVTRFTLQPVEQRRSEIETQVLVDRHERAIRFLGDAHVPIMLRRGRRLGINQSRQRVFPWRLVEMAVDDGEAMLWCAHPIRGEP